MGTQDPDPSNLKGIVEADETYVLESRKGDRNLDRKARRRGGKASKRGACQMNRFRYWLLQTAAEQRLALFFHLSSVTAASVQSALEPRIDDDILLVTDGNNVYPPCAKALGIKHEALNQSAGERVRGRLKLSQKLSQIGKFFSDLLRLRMAAVDEQCCAPGVLARSGNTGQQQGTTGDRFSPYHWLKSVEQTKTTSYTRVPSFGR